MAEDAPLSSDLADSGRRGIQPDFDLRVARLVQNQFNFIWRSLRRLGLPPAAVDDASQKVFFIASQKMQTMHLERERPFLFAIALRVAADERRAIRRRPEVADGDRCDDAEDHAPGQDELVERREARALLDRILEVMPLDLRAVFVLFEIEEMSTSEIAALLEIPSGTVASRLRRARETFEDHVARFRAHDKGGGAG